MQLLVSVRSAVEARAALEGGADWIDAKDPQAGALGAVTAGAFRAIHAAVRGARPVTAALGDAFDEASIETLAADFAIAGAALVKVGFAGVSEAARVRRLLEGAARGAARGDGQTVAVAYADSASAEALSPEDLMRAITGLPIEGVLIDTADKSGPSLPGLAAATLTAWVAEAHARGLFVALAGKLTSGDLPRMAKAGADIVGVRSAACEGGRLGRVTSEKVRGLKALCPSPVEAHSL